MKHTLFSMAMILAIVWVIAPPVESAEPTYTGYGEVLEVTPVVRREQVVEPVERCELVQARRQHGGLRLPPPPHRVLRSIVGSLIGGAIGNQFGGGRGKDVLTVAGAVAGAQIANQPRRSAYGEPEPRHALPHREERCRIVDQRRTIEQPAGYQVRYRYAGEVFSKRMDTDPGERIALQVHVAPVAEPLAQEAPRSRSATTSRPTEDI